MTFHAGVGNIGRGRYSGNGNFNAVRAQLRAEVARRQPQSRQSSNVSATCASRDLHAARDAHHGSGETGTVQFRNRRRQYGSPVVLAQYCDYTTSSLSVASHSVVGSTAATAISLRARAHFHAKRFSRARPQRHRLRKARQPMSVGHVTASITSTSAAGKANRAVPGRWQSISEAGHARRQVRDVYHLGLGAASIQ